MAKFFIERPIFAWVIAIIIMLAGLAAVYSLPIAQYPNIAPPAISIAASYPGANAKTLEDSVTQVIEQRMNGIDHLRYMASTSDSAGNVSITLTFDAGTDPDIAQVQVQNKVQLAMPLLPQEVQQQGVRVTKSVRNFLIILGFVSTDGSMTRDDISDYVATNLQDVISRVPGVGDIQLFGPSYAMRVWLNPDSLANYRITVNEVIAAMQAQNTQVSAGLLGGTPAVPGQRLTATITAQTRLETPEEFGDILLRVNPDGSAVCLRDVARIELGGENYAMQSRYNGQPASGMAVRPAPGANAMETARLIREKISALEAFFPPGLKVEYPLDTTPFVRIAITEVVKTLAEAIILVFLVMYLFMQNFRATLIPTIAVPVVLLGTFAVMQALGFSINTLTMFGMVLAIGLLVDDAIVVVENVERVMSEEGLSPKEATKKSMGQITGALIGIGLVLSAVFVPMAFFGGSVGVIYRQFSITVVSAMVLSVLVAIVLTPALCATMLQPIPKGHHHGKRGFFGWFNRTFDRSADRYASGVGKLLQRTGRSLIVYAVILGGMALLFLRMPTGFLPEEDQGILFAQVQMPVGATQEQTLEVIKQVEHYFLNEEKNAESILTIAGYSFGGQGQNAGMAFIKLKDWSERSTEADRVRAIAQRAMMKFASFKDGIAYAFAPPAVMEMGTANGFDFRLQDRAGLGHEKLMDARGQFLQLAAQNPNLANVRPSGFDDTPQFRVDIDRKKASALGLSLSDINRTLSTAWGSSYVNDFIDQGRVKRVYLQADAPYRMLPDDLNRWYMRNARGEMVPFSAFASGRWTYGSPLLERYNGLPSIAFQGQPAAGKSTGDAMQALEEIASQLPGGIGYEWSGLSYEERLSGSQAPMLYAISLLVVFLCLAALYESWSIPFAVMLVVPLGVIGALLAASLRGLPNDVYFQVGLLTTVGLSCKNAILIVEFAKAGCEQGMSLVDATVQAARQRLRPILMTSFAFILGVLPLVRASGAGSGSQNAIGTGVMGGMLSATFLAILLVPVFFVAVLRIFKPTAAPLAKPTDNRISPQLY
ncbi:efflux RND transporter permease subunit [Termitidicoccus mucosus]|uniref:Multidrug transporter n=1 Tax=Termitidicoccus mucosus TaxID=1184151 RepID=A0A178IH78_9BACT|nr:multidrug transporter [Opitutaceae bacterium TSB47]